MGQMMRDRNLPQELYFEGPSKSTGERLCYFEWGVPTAGKPSILFLHATGFHARIWDRVIAHLPADSHIIAPDLRGHGRSFQPDSLAQWDLIAADIVDFIDWLDVPPLYGIGHSMGGFCIAYVAAQRPQHFARALLIDPVILDSQSYIMGRTDAISPSTIQPHRHPIARRRNRWNNVAAMISYFRERPPYAAWDSKILADYCTYGLTAVAKGDKDTGEKGEGMELACPPMLEASVYLGVLQYDPYPLLDKVVCPLLVLRAQSGDRNGPLDFRNSPTLPELAGYFPNGRDSQWSNVSHFIPMEAPARLAELIVAEMAHIPSLL